MIIIMYLFSVYPPRRAFQRCNDDVNDDMYSVRSFLDSTPSKPPKPLTTWAVLAPWTHRPSSMATQKLLVLFRQMFMFQLLNILWSHLYAVVANRQFLFFSFALQRSSSPIHAMLLISMWCVSSVWLWCAIFMMIKVSFDRGHKRTTHKWLLCFQTKTRRRRKRWKKNHNSLVLALARLLILMATVTP